MLINEIRNSKHIVTIEEHSMIGGIGSDVAELILENRLEAKFKKIGFADSYCRNYGTREYLHNLLEIDDGHITDKLLKWISVK